MHSFIPMFDQNLASHKSWSLSFALYAAIWTFLDQYTSFLHTIFQATKTPRDSRPIGSSRSSLSSFQDFPAWRQWRGPSTGGRSSSFVEAPVLLADGKPRKSAGILGQEPLHHPSGIFAGDHVTAAGLSIISSQHNSPRSIPCSAHLIYLRVCR